MRSYVGLVTCHSMYGCIISIVERYDNKHIYLCGVWTLPNTGCRHIFIIIIQSIRFVVVVVVLLMYECGASTERPSPFSIREPL